MNGGENDKSKVTSWVQAPALGMVFWEESQGLPESQRGSNPDVMGINMNEEPGLQEGLRKRGPERWGSPR